MVITRRRAFATVFSLSLLGLSCGGPSMNPKAEVARSSLQTALEAWRAGKKQADLAQADPPIQVNDNIWVKGRKLDSFEIIEEVPSDTDKRFKTKLTYSSPAATSEVLYIVLGAQPVVIFREEDYARAVNMDNNPVEKKKRR